MLDDARLRRIFSGMLALQRDTDALRLVKRFTKDGRRRVRPSTRPLRRGLIGELSELYREAAEAFDPTLRLTLPPPPPEQEGDQRRGTSGFAEWRAQVNERRYTLVERQHVLTLGAALNALDRLEQQLSELDERSARDDDYAPAEVFELIETILIALAPVTLNHRVLERGLRSSRAGIKRQRKRRRSPEAERERRWMLETLGRGRVTSSRAWKVAGEVVRQKSLASPTDRVAFRRAQTRLHKCVKDLYTPTAKPLR